MKPPAIGLHFDVPEAVYRSWPAVCQSDLGPIASGKTLAHAREAIMNPKEPTPAMELGTAVHRAILEPSLFEEEFAVWPGADRRTKAGKAKWLEFTVENAGKGILEKGDFDHCCAMRDSAWRHAGVAALLTARKASELCVVWEDPETELLCKGRIDVLTTDGDWTVVADIKTTTDASEKGFAKAIANYGYHRQAAFYLDGLDALQPRARVFYFLAIEKEAPHCAAVYELDYESLEHGRREIHDALAKWKQAEESGVWPGYPTEVKTLELPRWAMSYSEEATI